MAVKLYVGDAGGIARRVKKLYVGDASGVAREVKTLYVGDGGGVARKVFDASGSAPAGRLPAGYTEVEYVQNGTSGTTSVYPDASQINCNQVFVKILQRSDFLDI